MSLPRLFILNERPRNLRGNASARDSLHFEEAARLLGLPVFDMPSNWREAGSLEDILYYLPSFSEPVPALVNGFIPFLDDYQDLYQYLRSKNLFLLNSPEECARVLSFARAYPLLADLTPKSAIIHSEEEIRLALQELNFPLFIKGAVRSLKAEGWTSCTAQSVEEATSLIKRLLASDYQSRGKVILRELVSLRHSRISEKGFPLGREYRVFLYRNQVLSLAYYWDGADSLAELSNSERESVKALARRASEQLGVPYVVIDVAQTTEGDWIVIEPGDAQFAGFGHNEVRILLNQLLDSL